MFQLFEKGGPIMWPLFITSVISVAVILERIIFILYVQTKREPKLIESVINLASKGEYRDAIQAGEKSQDPVVVTLVYGLKNRENSLSNALMKAANQELKRFNQGLFVLDTVITLAPLLGLLATVTGMIHAFGLLGAKELEAPAVITGGIAEALIGTAFGLGIAIIALIPFNFLNSKMEEVRHEIEDASTQLELICKAGR